MTKEELELLLNDAVEYLDYVGWGDSWERECYADTRTKLQTWQAQYELEQGVKS